MTTNARDDIEQYVAQVVTEATPRYSPQARERALAAMVTRASGGVALTGVAGTRAVSHLVSAAGVLLILAAVAVMVLPPRPKTGDRSARLAASQTLDRPHSIRIVRGPTDRVPPGIPLTFFLSGWGGPHTEERTIAVSPRSVRRLDIHDGSLYLYLVEDADTGEFASYDRRTKTIYTADLRPAGEKATLAVADNAKQMWQSEQFDDQLASLKANVKGKGMRESVTNGVYLAQVPMQISIAGKRPRTADFDLSRACRIVTIGWTVAKKPKLITSRVEFYVDTNNKRPFAERQYLKIEGQREKLIGDITQIAYDVPFPPKDRVPFPPGTKTAKGTARPIDIRSRFGHAVGFQILADGKQIGTGTLHVPD